MFNWNSNCRLLMCWEFGVCRGGEECVERMGMGSRKGAKTMYDKTGHSLLSHWNFSNDHAVIPPNGKQGNWIVSLA